MGIRSGAAPAHASQWLDFDGPARLRQARGAVRCRP